jgi:hypothetical protein
MEFATPLSHEEERINAYHDGEQLWYCTMEDLIGDQPVPELVPHDLEAQLHLACDDGEPRSFAEAERHAAWHAAMQSEMDGVQKNRTWELADHMVARVHHNTLGAHAGAGHHRRRYPCPYVSTATFQMSDLGPLSFYLGIEVHQNDSGIIL